VHRCALVDVKAIGSIRSKTSGAGTTSTGTSSVSAGLCRVAVSVVDRTLVNICAGRVSRACVAIGAGTTLKGSDTVSANCEDMASSIVSLTLIDVGAGSFTSSAEARRARRASARSRSVTARCQGIASSIGGNIVALVDIRASHTCSGPTSGAVTTDEGT